VTRVLVQHHQQPSTLLLPFEDNQKRILQSLEGALFKPSSSETAADWAEFELGSNSTCGLRGRHGASVTASRETQVQKDSWCVYHFAAFLIKRFLQKFVWHFASLIFQLIFIFFIFRFWIFNVIMTSARCCFDKCVSLHCMLLCCHVMCIRDHICHSKLSLQSGITYK